MQLDVECSGVVAQMVQQGDEAPAGELTMQVLWSDADDLVLRTDHIQFEFSFPKHPAT